MIEVREIFTQVEDHKKQAKGGLGIGLALVRQLVELHEGSIVVRSEGQGKGTTFAVCMPIVACAGATIQHRANRV